jgi:threonine dehydratase
VNTPPPTSQLPRMTHGIPTLADFEDAAAALEGVIARTPLDHSQHLSDVLGVPVHLKLENLQRTGSFKIRGATYRLSRLTEQERARGVVAASAGNHAQGVALAAKALGISATIFMPLGVPVPKLLATRGYGAEVVLEGATVETPLRLAAEFAERTGAVFIHPFDHPDVVAGQGTVGLEIIEQCPQVRTIAIPVGGGGLAAGIAVAVSGAGPAVKVVGVQAEAFACYPVSLAAGHPVRIASAATMADGIAVSLPGDIGYEIISRNVDRVVTVSEEALSRALLLCLERSKQVVEPAGAAGVAALLEHPEAFEPPVVAVLSGGNIDPLLLAKVLRHGLSAAGRYLMFRCRIADRPGALATLLGELAGLGANVLDVVHERVAPRLRVDEVEVLLQVETRGPGHCDEVISQLRQAGYTLLFG